MDETQEPSLGLGPTPAARGEAYRVLARKYRPQDFTGLIGQEALVKTLRNASAAGGTTHPLLAPRRPAAGQATTSPLIARGHRGVRPRLPPHRLPHTPS